MLHPQILSGRKSFQMHVKIFMKPNSGIPQRMPLKASYRCRLVHDRPFEQTVNFLSAQMSFECGATCFQKLQVWDTKPSYILYIWWCMKHLSLSSSLLAWEARCLSSVSWCELIILCWSFVWVYVCVCARVCVCVCVCVFFCYCKRKWQSPSTTSRPHIFECINSLAIANASPMPITFLWIAKMERDRDMGRQRYGEVCAGVRRRGRSSLYVSVLIKNSKKKKS